MHDETLPAATETSDAHVERPPAETVKSPPKWPILMLLALVVIVPAVFWQRVWFGSRLSDDEIRRRLVEAADPRDVQHACEQISKRMQSDPQRARQFYGPLASLADHPNEEIRIVAAWCMGEDDTRHGPFHQALLNLAEDEAPRVRYNAALALARLGDAAARPALREMLTPYTVPAHWTGPSTTGVVVDVLKHADPVKPRTQLALVDTGEGEMELVLAPVGGKIGEVMARLGESIQKGEPACTIRPDSRRIYEALRGLALIGDREDLPYVQRFVDAQSSFSRGEQARIQAQAKLTVEAIRNRLSVR